MGNGAVESLLWIYLEFSIELLETLVRGLAAAPENLQAVAVFIYLALHNFGINSCRFVLIY